MAAKRERKATATNCAAADLEALAKRRAAVVWVAKAAMPLARAKLAVDRMVMAIGVIVAEVAATVIAAAADPVV